MRDAPIGIFDSGIGGLTVLKETLRELPGESFLYLGDTARVPYGIRSTQTVMQYSTDNARFLLSQGIKLLIVACNTSSAISLGAIERDAGIPVIGVIAPGARAAVAASKNKRIGVIGTEATIRSGAYAKAIEGLAPEVKVFSRACPMLVPLAEEGWTEGEVARLTASTYLKELKQEGIDTLLLGCTHYPLLKGTFRAVLGNRTGLIDSASETALEVKDTLKSLGIENNGAGGGAPAVGFFVTDGPERFRRIGEKFLGRKIENIQLVKLGEEENTGT